jgi:peptidoglycan hydrolase-like protein with peptidoglycan-binding domain
MGTRTRDAIRDFEGRTGMPVSGEATPVLVAKIQQVIDARLAEQQTQKTAPQTSPPAQQPAKSAESPAPATAAAAVASTAETAAIDETDESYETDEAAETAKTTETAKKIILNSTTIAKLQADLDVLGYDPGPADGKMGDRTLNAIRQYQRSAGLGSSAEPSQLLLAKLSEDAAKAPKTSKKQNTAAKRSQGGNTEIQGALKFQRASSGALLGCSIKGVQLDRVWCDPFVARRNTSDCKVVLRPNSEVLLVKCS